MRNPSFYIRHPKSAALAVLTKLSFFFPDKLYLKLRYWLVMDKWLDFDNPVTFNEKLQWLKLYNRKPEYTTMVDKFAVKKYVAGKIGDEYIIPTFGVWNSAEEIEFDMLPNQFVLKTTHGGGGQGVIVCKDKSMFNCSKAISKLNKSLKQDIYSSFREWPYKNVPRRIIAEQYMEEESGSELKDYKFFCFNGEPRLCQIISDRRTDEKIDFYDMEWKRIEGLVGLNPKVTNSNVDFSCPVSFQIMKRNAAILSKNIPFSRIDFYEVNGSCYFGEITFFPAGGFGRFKPDEWNTKLGTEIHLP